MEPAIATSLTYGFAYSWAMNALAISDRSYFQSTSI